MPAAARGLFGMLHQHSLRLPSSIRVALFSARSQCAHTTRASTRFPSAQSLRHYVKPSRAQPAVKPNLRSYMVSDPSIRTVLSTKQTLLLYEAPARNNPRRFARTYLLACSFAAAGLFSVNYYSELRDREGLAFFVAPTYVVVGIMLIAISTWIFTFPVSRVTSIELIPSSGTASVALRIKARVNPWMRDKIIVCNIGETSIREKVAPIKKELVEAARARQQSLTQDTENLFIINRMLIILGRFIDQKWTSFFLKFKFFVLRFDVVRLNVRGDTWKLDCSGWMLEDGLAIDRLVMQED